MPFIDSKAPKAAKSVKVDWTMQGHVLKWKQPKGKKWDDEVNRYVVYRFLKGEKVDLNDASKIVTVTYDTSIQLPYRGGDSQYVYVVTALDRMSNESKGVKKKVRL
jgi:hypothetical protein